MRSFSTTWFTPLLGVLALCIPAVGTVRVGFAAEAGPAPPPDSVAEEASETAAIMESDQPESDPAVQIASSATGANTLSTCLAAFLVFFMQAGFALVECGFTRAKNACNIIMKNLMDFCLGSIVFWFVGFGLMFGVTNGFFGTTNFFYDAYASGGTDAAADNFNWAFLIFQTVFCATAATIVSGAMAERTKFSSYLRVSAEEEIDGLDICEHGVYAYPPAMISDGSNPAGQPAGKPIASPVAVS